MVAKMVLPSEGFAADIAGEGPLIRVSALMDEQVVGLGEVTFTILTNVLLLGPEKKLGFEWKHVEVDAGVN